MWVSPLHLTARINSITLHYQLSEQSRMACCESEQTDERIGNDVDETDFAIR